jgi:hypothetical protein
LATMVGQYFSPSSRRSALHTWLQVVTEVALPRPPHQHGPAGSFPRSSKAAPLLCLAPVS